MVTRSSTSSSSSSSSSPGRKVGLKASACNLVRSEGGSLLFADDFKSTSDAFRLANLDAEREAAREAAGVLPERPH